MNTFFVRPGENEKITADLTLLPDSRSLLLGTVKNPLGQPLPGALVILMDAATAQSEPVFRAANFTDENGQYYFGPLEPGRLCVVKVFYNSLKLRELEIVTE